MVEVESRILFARGWGEQRLGRDGERMNNGYPATVRKEQTVCVTVL
jgi:hypothetical protein